MKSHKIISKSYTLFSFGKWKVGFYYATTEGDNSIYIDSESVKDIVNDSINEVKTIDVEYLTKENVFISNNKAYSLYDFIEHLKPEPLKYIARYGFKLMVSDPFLNDYVDDKPLVEKERNLSEFDKIILKAMKYNKK